MTLLVANKSMGVTDVREDEVRTSHVANLFGVSTQSVRDWVEKEWLEAREEQWGKRTYTFVKVESVILLRDKMIADLRTEIEKLEAIELTAKK